MKRKLRIFTSIAVIALSVCMFAFGVYAASTVSVTTSGTVSFTATDVYATVQMSVNGTTKNAVADKSVTFHAGVAKDAETWDNTNIQFKDDGSDIVMTFTVTNNASDRPLYVYMRDDSVATTKMSKTIQNVGSNYTGSEIVVSALGTTSFTVTFAIEDKNVSIKDTDGIEYSLFINLASESFIKGATFTSETSNSTYGKVSQVTKNVEAGTITLNATLEKNSEFLGWFEVTGGVEGERIGDLLETTIQAKVGVTNYLAKFREISKNTQGKVCHVFNDSDNTVMFGDENSYGCHSLLATAGDVLVIPAQIRKDTDKIYTVTAIGNSVFGYDAMSLPSKKVIIANTVEVIGENFLDSAPNVVEIVLPRNLKVIKDDAFYSMGDGNNVYDFVLPEGFTTIEGTPFKYNFSITIPSTMLMYEKAGEWDWWYDMTSTIKHITFNENVDGEMAVELVDAGNTTTNIERITINSSSVLNNIEELCSITNNYYGNNWNGDGLFWIRVLKSLNPTSNSFLNDPANRFTKTEDGDYYVYKCPTYYFDSWTGGDKVFIKN